MQAEFALRLVKNLSLVKNPVESLPQLHQIDGDAIGHACELRPPESQPLARAQMILGTETNARVANFTAASGWADTN